MGSKWWVRKMTKIGQTYFPPNWFWSTWGAHMCDSSLFSGYVGPFCYTPYVAKILTIEPIEPGEQKRVKRDLSAWMWYSSYCCCQQTLILRTTTCPRGHPLPGLHRYSIHRMERVIRRLWHGPRGPTPAHPQRKGFIGLGGTAPDPGP